MSHKRKASAQLEAFIDESIGLARQKGYFPTAFIEMRSRHGTIEAIERLVQSGEIQSGFKKMSQLGLRDWTVESAVLKFFEEFQHQARECSEWRLQQMPGEGNDGD